MRNAWKIAGLLGLMYLAACQSNPGTSANGQQDSLTVHDGKGDVKVPVKPSKVVVLDFGALETLDFLHIPVAGMPKANVPEHLKGFEEDQKIADVGTLLEPNLENISLLQPDLIIASARSAKVYDELAKIAATVYYNVDDKDYLNSLKSNLRMLGDIFGEKARIDSALKALDQKIAETREKISKQPGNGLVVMFNEGKFSAYGAQSRFGYMHDVLGVPPAAKDLSSAVHGTPVSNEFILKTDPDYLFVIDRSNAIHNTPVAREAIENKLIKQTKAYKDHHLVYLNAQLWYISGNGIRSISEMTDEVAAAYE